MFSSANTSRLRFLPSHGHNRVLFSQCPCLEQDAGSVLACREHGQTLVRQSSSVCGCTQLRGWLGTMLSSSFAWECCVSPGRACEPPSLHSTGRAQLHPRHLLGTQGRACCGLMSFPSAHHGPSPPCSPPDEQTAPVQMWQGTSGAVKGRVPLRPDKSPLAAEARREISKVVLCSPCR